MVLTVVSFILGLILSLGVLVTILLKIFTKTKTKTHIIVDKIKLKNVWYQKNRNQTN